MRVFFLISIFFIQGSAEAQSCPMDAYLRAHYLEPKTRMDNALVANVYGQPEKSRAILLLFTSLGCGSCRNVHQNVLPAFFKMCPKDVAIIEIDYPADPPSFQASMLLTLLKPHLGTTLSLGLRHHLFEKQDQWLNAGTKVLDQLKDLTRSFLKEKRTTGNEAKDLDAIHAFLDSLDPKKLQEKEGRAFFEERLRTKQAFSIETVPLAIGFVRSHSSEALWTVAPPISVTHTLIDPKALRQYVQSHLLPSP